MEINSNTVLEKVPVGELKLSLEEEKLADEIIEATIGAVEAEIKESVEFLTKDDAAVIFKADDKVAYTALLEKLEEGHSLLVEWFGDTDMSRAISNQKAKLVNAVEGLKEKHKIVGTVVSLLGKLVKKVIGLVFNIVGFVADTTVIAAGVVGRTLVGFGREVKAGGKAVSENFKTRFC